MWGYESLHWSIYMYELTSLAWDCRHFLKYFSSSNILTYYFLATWVLVVVIQQTFLFFNPAARSPLPRPRNMLLTKKKGCQDTPTHPDRISWYANVSKWESTVFCLKQMNFPFKERIIFKKWIQILECSWNHEYFGSSAPTGFTLTLQETRSIHDSMSIPKIEFITYIYILYYQSTINFLFSSNLAAFPDILN